MGDSGLLEFRPRKGSRLHQAPHPPDVSDERVTAEGATALARAILEEAYEGAAEIRLEALERARDESHRLDSELKRTRTLGEEDILQLRSQAAMEAQLVVQRARRMAEQTLARAQVEAAAIVKAAEEAAAEARRQADERMAEVLASAERAMQDVEARKLETERLEAGLAGVANDFLRWMGLTERPQRALVGRLRPRLAP